jgi:phage baseplate assembly protein W
MICAFGLSAKSIIVSHADATMKQTIQDILEIFREEAASNRDLGDKFERLITVSMDTMAIVNALPALKEKK